MACSEPSEILTFSNFLSCKYHEGDQAPSPHFPLQRKELVIELEWKILLSFWMNHRKETDSGCGGLREEMAGFFHPIWEQLESRTEGKENILRLCLALSSSTAGNKVGTLGGKGYGLAGAGCRVVLDSSCDSLQDLCTVLCWMSLTWEEKEEKRPEWGWHVGKLM